MAEVRDTFLRSSEDAKAWWVRVRPEDWTLVAVDTEFLAHDDGTYDLYYFQISNGRERVCVDGPFTSKAKGLKLDLVTDYFKDLIEDPKIKKLYSNMPADVPVLEAQGFKPKGFYADTQVMDWLGDENRMFHGLKECAYDHCHLPMTSYAENFQYHPPKKNGEPMKKWVTATMEEVVWGHERFEYIPWSAAEGRARAEKYAIVDPYATFIVYEFLRKKLEKLELWDHYQNIEKPFGRVLTRMMPRGIMINIKKLKEIHHKIVHDLLRIEHVFKASVNDPDINIGSDKQLKALFFGLTEDGGLGVPITTKSEKTGEPSLDAAALDKLSASDDGRVRKLARWVLAYRQGSTLDGTFITGSIRKSEHSVLRTVFKHTGTKTGRLASGDRKRKNRSNLQNIPARPEKDPYKLRSFFIARSGKKLIVADYSQVELMISAQFSEDKRMIQAFARGEDLHMITASEMFGIALPKIPKSWDANHPDYKRWKQECAEWKKEHESARKDAKAIGFGLGYGMTPYKLHKDLDIPLEEAERRVQAYYTTYSGMKRWGTKQIKLAEENGRVPTIAGRWRNVPELAMLKRQLAVYGTGWLKEGKKRDAKRKLERQVHHMENQVLNCVDMETEVLTKRGWLRGNELQLTDEVLTKDMVTEALEWERPTAVNLYPKYKGKLVEFKSKSFSAVSTLAHRWLVRNHNVHLVDCCKTTAELSTWGDHRIHRTGQYLLESDEYTEHFISVCGWFLTDGFAAKNTKSVGLCQSQRANPHKVKMIERALRGVGFRIVESSSSRRGGDRKSPKFFKKRDGLPTVYRRLDSRTQMVTWVFTGYLADELRRRFPQRVLTPQFVAELSTKHAHLLLKTMMLGDGTAALNGPARFCTRSKQSADLFQFLATLCGQASTCRWRTLSQYHPRSSKMKNVPKMTGIWLVTLLRRQTVQVTRRQRSSFRGRNRGVWCPTVPNTFFVARRKGCVYITGNSPIQGSAADIIKVAMNRIEFDKELARLGVEMLLQVHDELVLEGPEETVEEALPIVVKHMEDVYPEVFVDVQLKVAAKIADNWMDAK